MIQFKETKQFLKTNTNTITWMAIAMIIIELASKQIAISVCWVYILMQNITMIQQDRLISVQKKLIHQLRKNIWRWEKDRKVEFEDAIVIDSQANKN